MKLSIGIFLLIAFSNTFLHGQGKHPASITIEDGLSQGMVYDLLQTRDGFIWIATKDGLNRYDGYNFKIFANNPFDPYSIADNTITALFEDSRGYLWAGLESKGIDVYDPATGWFHHFSLNFESSLFSGEANVVRILETADGAIWLVVANGILFKITIPDTWNEALPATPNFQRINPPKFVSIPSIGATINREKNRTHDLVLLPSGELLVATIYDLYLVDKAGPSLREMPNLPIMEESHRLVLSNNDIWVANNTEIRCIRNKQARIFPIPASIGLRRKTLQPGRNGNIWLFINNMMWEIGPEENIDFFHPDIVLDEPPTRCMYDNAGNFWIGTQGYGLRKINAIQEHFHAGGSSESINGLWANRGRYFVKLAEDIKPYDPVSGEILDRPAFPDAPSRPINLVFEPSGGIWLMCSQPNLETQKGFIRYYPPGNFEHASKEFEFKASLTLKDPFIRSADGQLWMVVNNGILIKFDPKTEQFSYYEFGYLFGKKVNAAKAIAITIDGNGIFWIGTQLGLVKCSPQKSGFDFQLIVAESDNPEGLNNNHIACLLPDPTDPKSKLWIGTKGGGINLMDTKTGKCRYITTANGLLNNVVYGILPANQPGTFWCSTNRGLARIVKQSDVELEIATYTASLGLQDNEFNTYAYFKSDEGELLFGGIHGLNRFFPEQLITVKSPPPVYIVAVEVNFQQAHLDSPIEHLQTLHLKYNQNNLSFEFAALDFTDPTKNRYRYRLKGIDDKWVATGNRHFAHFNHLAPGRYEFQVEGSNGESEWQHSIPIVMIISPPWWRSTLAYLGYSLLVIWVLWRIYKFQIGRIKLREQLAFELRENQRVTALEQLKTNLFNNVTHELRTPLTLIIEPLRQMLSEVKNPQVYEKIRMAENNSRKLLHLVNQLLDMAKLESGAMKLDLRPADFRQTVRGVFESFLFLADKRRINLTMPLEEKTPFAFFDKDKVELIVNNLLSNALKFTPEGGTVKIHCSLPDSTRAQVEVTDTGMGIPAEALDKVFDRFYQVDGSHTRASGGTGIGLALSRELVELMGGEIKVESEPGKGSSFTFWIPLHEKNTGGGLEEEEIISEKYLETGAPLRNATEELPVALVVEDNFELRQFIKTSIENHWQVVEASDGEEGLAKAVELLPDLIISDLMMPRKDGYTLCDELKNNELTAHIPVILLTAKSAIDAKIKGLQTGADDYITKPFHTGELMARMENLIDIRRKLRERFAKMYSSGTPQATTTPVPDFVSSPDREFIRKLTLTIEQNLEDEKLGVEEFAKKMNLSRVQLHRKLKAITDSSTTDFIRNYRLERAYPMLKNREGSVMEIASRVGFGNEKYFSTVFKEKYGRSPSQVM